MQSKPRSPRFKEGDIPAKLSQHFIFVHAQVPQAMMELLE